MIDPAAIRADLSAARPTTILDVWKKAVERGDQAVKEAAWDVAAARFLQGAQQLADDEAAQATIFGEPPAKPLRLN